MKPKVHQQVKERLKTKQVPEVYAKCDIVDGAVLVAQHKCDYWSMTGRPTVILVGAVVLASHVTTGPCRQVSPSVVLVFTKCRPISHLSWTQCPDIYRHL